MPVVSDYTPVRERNLPETVRRFEGTTLFDFGTDMFGQLEFRCAVETETEIECTVGEVLAPDGRLNRTPGGSRIAFTAAIRIVPGKTVYRFPLPHHPDIQPGSVSLAEEVAPFRYAEFRAPVSVEPVRIAFHAPFNDSASAFHSSDENLNRVHELCRHTIRATTVFGVYIDGNRERLPYEGDAYINQLGHFALDADYALARRTIDHLFKFPTWPTEWLLAMPLIARDYWLHSADFASVRRWYAGLTSKLLLNFTRADGLLSTEGNQNPRDIVDWPMTERDGYEFGEINLVPNCWLYRSLLVMAELADALELSSDAEYFRSRAALLRASIRRTMLKSGRFVDNPESDHMSLHGAVFAVLFDVADPEEVPALAPFIRSRGMACSVFVAQFLLEACFRCGLADYALELMTSDSLRSWMNMIRKGATMAMEAWDDTFKPNQDWNHPWGAAPANMIPRGLFGIRPLKPGFAEFEFAPQPGGLDAASYVYPTLRGAIHAEIRRESFSIEVPSGTLCHFRGAVYAPGMYEFPR